MNIPFSVSVPMASMPFHFQLAIAVASLVFLFACARLSNWAVGRSVAKMKRERTEDEAKWPRHQGVLEIKRVRLPSDARPVPGNLTWSFFRGGIAKLPPTPIDHPHATFHAEVSTPGGKTVDMRIDRETFVALNPGDVFCYAQGRYRDDPEDAVRCLYVLPYSSS